MLPGESLGIDSDLVWPGSPTSAATMEPTCFCEIVAVAALLAHRERVAVDEKGRPAARSLKVLAGVAGVLSKIDDYQVNENDGLAMTCRQR